MRWVIGIVCVIGLAVAAALLWPVTPVARHVYFEGLPDRPLVIAHQGGEALRPSNTLWSFHAAAAMGVDVLEGDVHLTRDGALVVIHDTTLDRTTDRTGAIADLTLAEVQAADAGAYFTAANGDSTAGLGIRVPTVREVLTAHPDMPFVLELKPDNAETANALCAELRALEAEARVLVGSFHDGALQAFRRVCPEVATSMSGGEVQTFYFLSRVHMAKFYPTAAVALQIPERAGDIHVADARLMAAAQARGLDVHIWTVNERADMERLLDLGATGIITDRPDLMLEITAARTAAQSPCALDAPSAEEAGPDCMRPWADHNLRVNQIQAIGTHNSYKLAIPPAELALIAAQSPDLALSLDYSHEPLAGQLDQGARQLELDLFHDPDGGRYADPAAPKITAAQGLETQPFDLTEFEGPGFKVMHIQDIDFRTSCVRFVTCLEQVRDWSRAHPDHAPILILLNLKEAAIPLPGSVTPLSFDEPAFDALDAEIRSVFGLDDLITPDMVRGGYASLREATRAGNWPRLGAARGRVLFALDAADDKGEIYRTRAPSLETRVLFINTGPDSPAAAYRTMNDPIAQAEEIRSIVTNGILVRTRADADTMEARSGDTTRREAAFVSGAHYVSTDYLKADERLGPYTVSLPGGAPARCNPVTASDGCEGVRIE